MFETNQSKLSHQGTNILGILEYVYLDSSEVISLKPENFVLLTCHVIEAAKVNVLKMRLAYN